MVNYNPNTIQLNSWQSMFNLGNQPKIPAQCQQNLRFINQESANSRNRYTLRRAFGNQLFNISTQSLLDIVIFTNTQNNNFTFRFFPNSFNQNRASNGLTSDDSILVYQNTQISQFNRSSTEFVFSVPKSFDLCANNIALGQPLYLTDVSLGEYIKSAFNQVGINLPSNFIGSNSNIDDLIESNKVTIFNLNLDNYYEINSRPNIVSLRPPGQDSSDVTLSVSDNTGEFRSGLTPFRKAFNAGDMFTRNNSATSRLLPKPPNQVNSLRNMFGWQNNAGSVNQNSDGSFYSGNPRFVYDGSDYARFRKLKAINRNYNDVTFGGDQYSASQQAYRRVVQR